MLTRMLLLDCSLCEEGRRSTSSGFRPLANCDGQRGLGKGPVMEGSAQTWISSLCCNHGNTRFDNERSSHCTRRRQPAKGCRGRPAGRKALRGKT
eukprot:scaffold224120_cov26-Tisochrysis_lutea.AAC.3